MNILLKGYIIVKKQGERTFHLTCLCENTISENNLSCDSQSLRSVDLSTYMFQTKQPQVRTYKMPDFAKRLLILIFDDPTIKFFFMIVVS